jgi:hypothetical protein
MVAQAVEYSGVGRKLHDLLVREAHLKLHREKLLPVWMAKEAELRAVEAARPRLSGLLRSRRVAYQIRWSGIFEELQPMRTCGQALDRCEPHVKRMIEEEIEVLLREHCPEYVQALAARQQKEDWCRCLERFATKIFEFTRTLGNVRNLACSGYARATQAYSPGAVQAFVLAIEAGKAVEEEVKFANRIATMQREMFEQNGFQAEALPRLPETRYSEWTARIRTLPLVEAQAQFEALIEETKKLHETGIPELRRQADQVDLSHANEIHNFLLVTWEQYRAQVAPEIYPGDSEASVVETERMLMLQAKTSVLGRL